VSPRTFLHAIAANIVGGLVVVLALRVMKRGDDAR
jgi:hypothetical protein